MMKRQWHWQDAVNMLVGVWMTASPLAFHFGQDVPAMINATVAGLLLTATASGATFVSRACEQWIEVALGTWLMISPWILAFSGHFEASFSTMVNGLLILAVAFWKFSDRRGIDRLWPGRGAP